MGTRKKKAAKAVVAEEPVSDPEPAIVPQAAPPTTHKREGMQPYKKRTLDSRSVERRRRHQNR